MSGPTTTKGVSSGSAPVDRPRLARLWLRRRSGGASRGSRCLCRGPGSCIHCFDNASQPTGRRLRRRAKNAAISFGGGGGGQLVGRPAELTSELISRSIGHKHNKRRAGSVRVEPRRFESRRRGCWAPTWPARRRQGSSLLLLPAGGAVARAAR